MNHIKAGRVEKTSWIIPLQRAVSQTAHDCPAVSVRRDLFIGSKAGIGDLPKTVDIEIPP